MERFFQLKENHTTVGTEIMAGLTTFFAMSYIIVVNPSILSQSGMEWGAVFLATILAAIVGTLIMGLVANVPYAQAPGKRIFRLYGLRRSGIYLAAGIVHGVYLRPSKHCHYGQQGAQIHYEIHSPQYAERHQRRYRNFCGLYRLFECGNRKF